MNRVHTTINLVIQKRKPKHEKSETSPSHNIDVESNSTINSVGDMEYR